MRGNKTYRHDSNPEEKLFHDKFVELCKINPDHVHRMCFSQSEDDRTVIYRLSDREEDIVVSAIQWLGSHVGQSFLRELGYTKTEKDVAHSDSPKEIYIHSTSQRDAILTGLRDVIGDYFGILETEIIPEAHLNINKLLETFNSDEARKAQKKLQEEKGYPDFAPSDGRCFKCKKDIYTQIDRGPYKTGISVEKAGRSLITGCPHCNRSYCD